MDHAKDKGVCITQLRHKLGECVRLSDHVESLLAKADNNKEHLSTLNEITSATTTLENLVSQMEDLDYLKRIKSKLSKIARHKAWRKRRIDKHRQARNEAKEKKKERCEELERRRIEAIRENERYKQQQAQHKEALLAKPQQDRQRNKITDMSRLLNRLTLLRDLRRRKLEAKGHFFADEGNEFFNKVKAWNEAMESAEDQKYPTAEQSDTDTLVMDPKDRWDSMELEKDAYLYWCQGLQSTDALRRVRRHWDRFIVKEDDRSVGIQGKVPPTFVDPPEPADDFWALYLLPEID